MNKKIYVVWRLKRGRWIIEMETTNFTQAREFSLEMRKIGLKVQEGWYWKTL